MGGEQSSEHLCLRRRAEKLMQRRLPRRKPSRCPIPLAGALYPTFHSHLTRMREMIQSILVICPVPCGMLAVRLELELKFSES